MIAAVHFWMFFGLMACLMIWQQIYFSIEVRRLTRTNQDLQNRLDSRDLREYAGITKSLAPQKADNTEEWSSEEIEQARDRIPIN